ncbi:hypothetical protein GCM10017774_74900 [Lentzea cavernae]|uniref:Uncharacterized protein n=2 Tax=Lentzea cavernae TaxID=2020703 RepID=A0ABQ3MQC1_9PSEU|nr:hypothetical protein GCM10017774_74900 [Lentzea cavernae]
MVERDREQERDELPRRPRRTAYNFFAAVVPAANAGVAIGYLAVAPGDPLEVGVPAHVALRLVLLNLLVAVLLRSAAATDSAYRCAVALGRGRSPAVRRVAGWAEGYGGLHVGFALSATLWFLVMNGSMLRSDVYPPTCVAVNGFLVVAFTGVQISAVGPVRHRAPGLFRVLHRCGTWTVVGLLWLQMDFVLVRRHRGTFWAEAVLPSPEFWLLVATSALLVLPWLRLRRVPVEVVRVSSEVVELRLGLERARPGALTMVSRTPLGPCHRFTLVVEPRRGGATLVVSRRLDWVSDLVDFPQSHLWVHAAPALAGSYLGHLHRSAIFVVTGTAIAEGLARLARTGNSTELVWVVHGPVRAYGMDFVDRVEVLAPDLVIVDTSVQPDVDFLEMARELHSSAGSDAVGVAGSREVVREVREGLARDGVPTFGG